MHYDTLQLCLYIETSMVLEGFNASAYSSIEANLVFDEFV
jgi:hypothetical protein